MKQYGPDSLISWVIACACCFCNTMIFGMARLSGLMFVASVPRFNVSREKASFPYTFASFVRNTSGPLVGYLGHRFGVRSVTTFGCLLGAVGAGACFWAESIGTVTVLWGTIFGLGYGLGNILLPVSINQYFDKHRATASGISFSGACLGSFILPPIVEFLINEYGLSGTYLFLSGFILNCVPAALLLKNPKYEIKQYPSLVQHENSDKIYTVNSSFSDIVPKDTKKGDCFLNRGDLGEAEYRQKLIYAEKMRGLSTQTLLSEYSIRMSLNEPLNEEQIIENNKGRRQVDPVVLQVEVHSLSSCNTDHCLDSEEDDEIEKSVRSNTALSRGQVPPEHSETNSTMLDKSLNNDKGFVKQNNELIYQNDDFQNDVEYLNVTNNLKTYSNYMCESSLGLSSFAKSTGQKDKKEKSIIFNNRHITEKSSCSEIHSCKNAVDNMSCQSVEVKLPQKKTKSFGQLSLLVDPMFILIAVTNGVYLFTLVAILTVIIDFSRDLNIGIENEKYVLMTLSVGDIVGRLGLGWITDGGYMTTTGYTALLFALQGVTIAAIGSSSGFLMLMIVTTLHGLAEAGLVVIFPIIIAQYIDQDKQTVAIPSCNFLAGPLCLAVSPVIGLFRDNMGAYDYLFYLLAVISFLCCLSWILAPCVVRPRKKKENA